MTYMLAKLISVSLKEGAFLTALAFSALNFMLGGGFDLVKKEIKNRGANSSQVSSLGIRAFNLLLLQLSSNNQTANKSLNVRKG